MLNSAAVPCARHGASNGGDLADVARADVALVRARMHRDAGRAGLEAGRRPRRCTLGTRPPRELRSVATLLTLTERLIIDQGRAHSALGDCRSHGVGDFLGPRLHRRLILALDHDAQQRLGARIAHEHAAAAVERRFDARRSRR